MTTITLPYAQLVIGVKEAWNAAMEYMPGDYVPHDATSLRVTVHTDLAPNLRAIVVSFPAPALYNPDEEQRLEVQVNEDNLATALGIYTVLVGTDGEVVHIEHSGAGNRLTKAPAL